MSKKLNKIVVTGASLIMMLSVGAGASQITSPVHANRITNRIAKLRTRRSHDYKDIKNINAELARLEKHTNKHYNTRKSNKRSSNYKKMYKLGEQQANNYLGAGKDYAHENAMVRDGKYLRTNKAYSKGWYNSEAYNADDDEARHTQSIIAFSKYYKSKAFVRGYFKAGGDGGFDTPSNNAMKHSRFALGEHYGSMSV